VFVNIAKATDLLDRGNPYIRKLSSGEEHPKNLGSQRTARRTQVLAEVVIRQPEMDELFEC
jgi:hypothetical protein